MDKLEKDLYFFHSLPLSELRARCNALSDQIMTHLSKCYLFPDSRELFHWIDEITSWIFSLSNRSTKGGKFKYDLIFSEYHPWTLKITDGFANEAKQEESELTAKNYTWKSLANFFKEVENNIKSLSNNSKRTLGKPEIQIIILNALRKFERIQ